MQKEENNSVEVEEVVEVEKDLNEKTAEELKADAEAVEAQIKEAKEGKDEDEIRQNQMRRLQKAQEKLEQLRPVAQKEKTVDVDVRDLLTLNKFDIQEGSEKAKTLQKYKNAGIIASFAEGLEHVGVKAELADIESRANAHSIIDGNADEQAVGLTKKEVIRKYEATGEVPSDPSLQNVVARDSLRKMGLL